MTEQPFFFENQGFQLAAFWHLPQSGCERGRLLFCAPFAEERKSSHRTFVETARALCEVGFVVLRFDYRGCGDSEGEGHQFTPEDWKDDIVAAWELLARDEGRGTGDENGPTPHAPCPSSPCGLLGLRLGASLVVEVAERLEPLEWLILWEPIVNGKRYLSLQLKRKKMRQMLIEAERGTGDSEGQLRIADCGLRNINADPLSQGIESEISDLDGYLLTKETATQINDIDLSRASVIQTKQALVLQIAATDRITKELQSIEPIFSDSHVSWEVVQLPPFWNQLNVSDNSSLIEQTVKWLQVSGSKFQISDFKSQISNSEDHTSQIKIKSEIRNRGSRCCGSSEIVVTFTNHESHLFGILHQPETNPQKVGIVMLHGWGSARVGPHRMFVQQARELCAKGFPCLRFDFRGRGDSEGDSAKTTLADMVEDTEAAIQWMLGNTPVDKIVLLGICSGSEVAFGAAGCHASIDGLVLWSAPVFAEGQSEEVRQARQRHYLHEYFKKFFRIATWRKAVSGRLQPRLIRQVMSGQQGEPAPKTGQDWRSRMMTRSRSFKGRILMIYGTNDPVTETALPWYKQKFDENQVPYELHIIPGANHSYYSWEWKRQVMSRTGDWLGQ